jgi:tetratricopeptide (TPR) repeat protein
MATSVQPARSAATTPPPGESRALTWLVQWIKGHRQAAAVIAAVVLIGAGLGWWTVVSRSRVEAAAGQRLEQARLAFESRNYPLAASELSQLVENYSGTRAAAQANLLLAQVRLYQGQGQQAIDLLKRVAPSEGRDFAAQAYGLLGAAYENAAHPAEAAGAYEEAARRAAFGFLKAQYLSDAGRTWVAARDTAKAVRDYQTIVSGMDSTATIPEAKVRLGELTHGAGGTGKP